MPARCNRTAKELCRGLVVKGTLSLRGLLARQEVPPSIISSHHAGNAWPSLALSPSSYGTAGCSHTQPPHLLGSTTVCVCVVWLMNFGGGGSGESPLQAPQAHSTSMALGLQGRMGLRVDDTQPHMRTHMHAHTHPRTSLNKLGVI